MFELMIFEFAFTAHGYFIFPKKKKDFIKHVNGANYLEYV